MFNSPQEFVAPFDRRSGVFGHVTIMSDCAGDDPEADMRADWLTKRSLGVGILPRRVRWKPLPAALGSVGLSWLGMAAMFGRGRDFLFGKEQPELFCTNAAPRVPGNPHGCKFVVVRLGNQFWMTTYTPGPLSELACIAPHLVEGQVWEIRLEVFLQLLRDDGGIIHVKNFRSAHMGRVFARLLENPVDALEGMVDLASIQALPVNAVRWVDLIEKEDASGTLVEGRNVKLNTTITALHERGFAAGERLRVTVGTHTVEATFSPQLGTDAGIVIAPSSSPGDLSGNAGADMFRVDGWLARELEFPAIGTPVVIERI